MVFREAYLGGKILKRNKDVITLKMKVYFAER